MYELDANYVKQLEKIAAEIQASDMLKQYLEEEEDEFYVQLKEAAEPKIYKLYKTVAAKHPLQLVQLEKKLLDPSFEGLFLPRILGFSVLRGVINEHYKYIRPQHHFQDILLTICDSANFDLLKKRIGQTIQIGFALSSDIWVTNLINRINNKRVRHFLQALNVGRLRVLEQRILEYNRYKKQFEKENFLSITFPDSASKLAIAYPGLERFLLYRMEEQEDNSSLIEPLDNFMANKALLGSKEHLYMCTIYGAFFDLPEKSKKALTKNISQIRKDLENADEKLFTFILELHSRKKTLLTPEADLRLAELFDTKIKDQLSEYFTTVKTIHTQGYTNEKTQETIHKIYLGNEGLSNFNECIRKTIFQYFSSLVNNLEATDYTEYFEITKLFAVYMRLFGNQQFNQHLKELSMVYVHKLIRHFTDKRGRDYQDIKKFVTATFRDFEFLTDKEIVILFKTRRKKRKPVEKA